MKNSEFKEVSTIIKNLTAEYPDSGFILVKTDVVGDQTAIRYNANLSKVDTLAILKRVEALIRARLQ